jgi:hypothetical protein
VSAGAAKGRYRAEIEPLDRLASEHIAHATAFGTSSLCAVFELNGGGLIAFPSLGALFGTMEPRPLAAELWRERLCRWAHPHYGRLSRQLPPLSSPAGGDRGGEGGGGSRFIIGGVLAGDELGDIEVSGIT